MQIWPPARAIPPPSSVPRMGWCTRFPALSFVVSITMPWISRPSQRRRRPCARRWAAFVCRRGAEHKPDPPPCGVRLAPRAGFCVVAPAPCSPLLPPPQAFFLASARSSSSWVPSAVDSWVPDLNCVPDGSPRCWRPRWAHRACRRSCAWPPVDHLGAGRGGGWATRRGVYTGLSNMDAAAGCACDTALFSSGVRPAG